MGARTYEITVRKTLRGSAADIWAAFADPDAYNAVHGCFETKIDLREGGRIVTRFFADRPGGETFVLQTIDPDRELVFHWEGHEAQRVTLNIEPSDDGVDVSLTQACGEDLDWLTNCLDGWAWILDSLERYLETGQGIPNDVWSRERGTHRVVRIEAGDS